MTSRRSREDVIPVRFSLDFAVGRGPSLDQHARKAELSQGMCEKVQVTGEPAGGEQQTRQALARDGQQGAGTKADDGGRYEAEHRGKGAETGRGKDLSHGREGALVPPRKSGERPKEVLKIGVARRPDL